MRLPGLVRNCDSTSKMQANVNAAVSEFCGSACTQVTLSPGEFFRGGCKVYLRSGVLRISFDCSSPVAAACAGWFISIRQVGDPLVFSCFALAKLPLRNRTIRKRDAGKARPKV